MGDSAMAQEPDAVNVPRNTAKEPTAGHTPEVDTGASQLSCHCCAGRPELVKIKGHRIAASATAMDRRLPTLAPGSAIIVITSGSTCLCISMASSWNAIVDLTAPRFILTI